MSNQIQLFLSYEFADYRSGKNSFTVRLNESINLRDFKNTKVALYTASVPYSWSNINSTNNTLVLSIPNLLITLNLTFETGTYSLQDINDAIYQGIIQADIASPIGQQPQLFPFFTGAESTGKISINFPATNSDFWQWDADLSTMTNILGFSSAGPLSGASTTTEIYEADTKSKLADLISIAYVYCSIARGGYLNRLSRSGIIHTILPYATSVGGIISSEPANIMTSDLINDYISEITISLLNIAGEEIDLGSENYSIGLVISYD